MCITFFCSLALPKHLPSFVLGFNREEQTKRQTQRFGQFQQDPNIYGGKDIQSGGTWLGVNIQTGLLVFLTNYSMHLTTPRKGISRGKLVRHFLMTNFIPQNKRNQTDLLIVDSLQQFSKSSQLYSPFNLVVVNLRSGNGYYICSEKEGMNPMILQKEVAYGLSNSDISTQWRKTNHGVKLFTQIIDKVDKLNQVQLFSQLTGIMQNSEKFDQLHPQMRSIFIEPYWNQRLKAERRTKTTSLLVLRLNEQGRQQIAFKELTYTQNKQQENFLRLNI